MDMLVRPLLRSILSGAALWRAYQWRLQDIEIIEPVEKGGGQRRTAPQLPQVLDDWPAAPHLGQSVPCILISGRRLLFAGTEVRFALFWSRRIDPGESR